MRVPSTPSVSGEELLLAAQLLVEHRADRDHRLAPQVHVHIAQYGCPSVPISSASRASVTMLEIRSPVNASSRMIVRCCSEGSSARLAGSISWSNTGASIPRGGWWSADGISPAWIVALRAILASPSAHCSSKNSRTAETREVFVPGARPLERTDSNQSSRTVRVIPAARQPRAPGRPASR